MKKLLRSAQELIQQLKRTSPLKLFLHATFAFVIGYFVCSLDLASIESILLDLRIKHRPAPTDTKTIELVYTTPGTVSLLQGLPGYHYQAQALKKIIEKKPRAVVYVSNLNNWKGSYADKKEFADTVDSFSNIYFPTDELELKGERGKSQFPPPLDQLKVIPGPKTADNTKFAKDGVTRRLLVSFLDQKMMHTLIAETYNPTISDVTKIRGTFELYKSLQTYIDYRPMDSFPFRSFEQVLNQPVDAADIADKIVIFGDRTDLDTHDYVSSPFSREGKLMPLAEMHANIFETLIRNSAPARAPDWLNLVFTLLISLLTVHVVLTLKPLKGILILMGTAVTFSAFCYFCFWPLNIWIDMAHPFLAIFLCYYFFIPYRLIVENRRSWEYYQKHKLLSEVEQLKTNFIGMMSHDLKTPLARIQGMTEAISKDNTPLSSTQREALDMIRQSAEDLLKFISTILNYAKIESQGVELHLQAKDINQILKEVIRKHEFLAQVKHIQLIAELEPLFSIEIDPELIKQVLSNLIENAIKYSPENSKVLISTEEANNKVVIQVADQGPGIPEDEVANVFMKFFRSKSAKSSPIRGSGLGLYLAKYFVELHRGAIHCESTPGQGSTFTVELPVKP
ncbi:MAG: histidine kinase [Bdellovibrio sp. CG10_big_fil_rev_8_21_14_0_10_47_8]|nr:MAG: histidine kinase [Bdellovibrio sp. CG10_big_fil_rev_8_21_14_0_10_47_8]